MKISYNWLKEFIDLELSPQETADKLTLIGLEVDETLAYGSLLEGVIVGKVLEVKKHPNADRLSLCRVDLGTGQVQIACGAPNVAEGQNVPVATVGTTLPAAINDGEPFTIKKAKLRGEISEGMICSESELKLGNDHSGIMVLDDDLELGTPLHKALNLSIDAVFDIELTPNRSDAASHLGAARDLAAALKIDFKKTFKTDYEKAEKDETIHIAIENEKKCHRYVGKVMRGIKVLPSPQWLQEQLRAIGARPVNNIVDVTNYVMHEMGQPLHAFDLKNVADNTITVRDFEEEVSFETLDHAKRKCSAGTLFICDGKEPVAIAGVMGGVNSEVTNSTTDILIESAWFEPGTVRRTAKRMGLQTDASYRFERGVDPKIQRIAAERAAELIAEICDISVPEECTDIHPVKFEAEEITLRRDFTNRILGTKFTLNEIDDLLDGLGFSIIEKNESSVTYNIPSFRPDLVREIDLIEEVGRLYDYNNIAKPEKIDFIEPKPLSKWEIFNMRVKDAVKSLRYKEIFTNSLIPQKDAALVGEPERLIHTLNPISAEMTTLRPSLQNGFLQSTAYNFNRNAKEVRFFEMGHVFKKGEHGKYYDGIEEETYLLIGLAGLKEQESWNTKPQAYTIFDLKAGAESLFSTLGISAHVETKVDVNNVLEYFIDGNLFGKILEPQKVLLNYFDIEQPTYIAEFSITTLFEFVSKKDVQSYQPVPKFPAFEFDFAVVVNADVRAQNLLTTITEEAEMLDNIQVFDLFEGGAIGENKKSIAFRLSFLNKNKTLTINDIEPIIEKVLKVLKNKYSAVLRNY